MYLKFQFFELFPTNYKIINYTNKRNFWHAFRMNNSLKNITKN